MYRLVDGPNDHEGRVEVKPWPGADWGTVCDDWWSHNDAHVLCRTLGYDYGQALKCAPYGQGSGPLWLTQLICDGPEPTLGACDHLGWGVTPNCAHNEDAGAICRTIPGGKHSAESGRKVLVGHQKCKDQ